MSKVSLKELRDIVGNIPEEADAVLTCIDTDTVAVPCPEYHNLVACEVLLDVILESKDSERDYYSDAVIKAAAKVRGKHTSMPEAELLAGEPGMEGGCGDE